MAKLLLLALVFPLVLQADPLLPEEVPYAATIEKVEDVEPVGRADSLNATLVLSTEVPNSEATVSLRSESALRQDTLLTVLRVTDVAEGKPTKKLAIQWSPKQLGFSEKQLVGRILQLYTFRYDRTIKKVIDKGEVGERDFHNVTVELDGFVPNTDTTLVVVGIDGKPLRLVAFSNKDAKTGHATTRLDIQVSEKIMNQLIGKSVRAYSPELPIQK